MIAGRLGHCIFERLLQEPAIALGSLSTLTNGAHAVEKLPDHLQDHLRLVFVGTAASQRSADLGHYYAHPGNRFWRTIHEVGITPRRYEPHEFPGLLKLGIGFTDMCKVGAGMDHEALNFPIDVPAFREKMLRYRPKTIAFTSKKAASLFLWTIDESACAGPAASSRRFSSGVRTGFAVRRRNALLVSAAVARTRGFDTAGGLACRMG